jgi:IMP dehydrogenase
VKFLNDLQPSYDLTYNDVFMVPGRSVVTSRFDVDLSTADGTGATLPLVVANMTAISGRRMAETIARRGGIAIIPQDIPLDIVERTVSRVKGAHTVYDTPVTVGPTTTVGEALSLLGKRAHGAVVVVEDGKVLGIVTERDGAEIDRFAQVREVMTTDILTFEAGADPRDCFNEMSVRHIDFAPVVDGGLLAGVLTRKAALRSTIYEPAVDAAGRLVIGAAVGINGDVAGKAAALLAMDVDVLVVDTAHGHQDKMLEAWPRGTPTPPRPAPGCPSRRATSCRRPACATSSPRAPTSSRSGSARGRCARPG